LYVEGGLDALADRSPRPKSVWNRIPQQVWDNFIEFALNHEALTCRELAIKHTDEKRYFISESSAYRILKAADLITAPAHVVIKAAAELVIPPFLMGFISRIQAAFLSFCIGVIPPMPMLGHSLL